MVMVFATTAAGAADAATAPKTFRTAIIKAELAQHSVHYVTTTLRAGATKAGFQARDVADVARDRGIQRWTVFSKGKKLGHITFLVVHATAYVRGDTPSVLGWGGFPHLHPRKWYSIPHNSQMYPLVARNVTLGSFAREVVPAHHLSILSGTFHGKAMRSLRGWARDQGGVITIYLPKRGSPLPVEGNEVARGIEVGLGHVTLSDWNEPVHLTAPNHAPPAP